VIFCDISKAKSDRCPKTAGKFFEKLSRAAKRTELFSNFRKTSNGTKLFQKTAQSYFTL
jgi:hypothetical protein